MKKVEAMNLINQIQSALHSSITIAPSRASAFFKTEPGQYAEGDEFIGVTVPAVRKIVRSFRDAPLDVVQAFLQSKINEERLLALLILVEQYEKAKLTADTSKQAELYQFYLNNLQHVNNWNLVDSSAHLIVGAHLWDKDRSLLNQLASSENLWERRISIVSTWYFIRRDDLAWTFRLASKLLTDKHDLIHKAVGWMLREAGKRSEGELLKFLDRHAATMPRTMLRYAVERLPAGTRLEYMNSKWPG